MCEGHEQTKRRRRRRRKVLGGLFLFPTLSFLTGHHRSARATTRTQPIVQPANPDPESFINRAVELADLSLRTGDGTGYGAVVVKDGLIIGEGRNRAHLLNDPTAQSEIDAIRDACSRIKSERLDGCEIYCSARPCPMCSSACYWASLDKIHVKSNPSNKPPLISYKPTYSNC